ARGRRGRDGSRPAHGTRQSKIHQRRAMNTLLHISNLTKRYGAVSALEQISIAIERASVLAVLGPNGAGKSTLFGCLLGLTLLSGGEIRFASTPARDRDRTSIGY